VSKSVDDGKARWYPRYLLVDHSVADHPQTLEIIAASRGAKVIGVSAEEKDGDRKILYEAFGIDPAVENEARLRTLSRQCLLLWQTDELTQHMATGPAWERRCFNFLKILPFTGTCTFNCAYCWFKDPVLIPRVNARFFDLLPAEVDRLEREGRRPMVLTFTHYKTDCFGLEHLTGFCRKAADFFETRPGFFIQFLTKSDWVDTLLTPPVPRRALLSFSINPDVITQDVDLGTASVSDRLAAARRVSEAGISIAFRVDPMMVFPGWEAAYDKLAEDLLNAVRPDQITLGTPRFQTMEEVRRVAELTPSRRAKAFMQGQTELLGDNKPGQSLGTDSDAAYFKNMGVSYPDETRIALYKNALRAFTSRDASLNIGLCEEGPEMWDAAGLTWTGDRTRDCSCNFVVPAARETLTSHDNRALVVLQGHAQSEDAKVRALNPVIGTALPMAPS